MKDVRAWALIDPRTDGIRGGEYRCAIFWTRAGAKLELARYPECSIVKVWITSDRDRRRSRSAVVLEDANAVGTADARSPT